MALTLISTALAGGLVPSRSAHADEVAQAQARVDKLQDLVKDTTRRLTEGTRKWEADQASLRTVQLKLGNTQRHVRAAEQVAADGQARVSAIARRLYMNPTPGTMQLALTSTPDDVLTKLQSLGALEMVAGSDGEIVRRAQVARLRLIREEQQVQYLTGQAQGLVDRSAKRLRELEALAQSTSDQLTAAQDALQRARSRAAAEAARRRASRLRPQQLPRCRQGQIRQSRHHQSGSTGTESSGRSHHLR